MTPTLRTDTTLALLQPARPVPMQMPMPLPAGRTIAVPGGPGDRFCDWLQLHRDPLFRFVLQHAGLAWPGDDATARRAFAAAAVTVQRQRGPRRCVAWLFGMALLVAHRQPQPANGLAPPMSGRWQSSPAAAPALRGRAPELRGLAPELRGLLRLVAAGRWRPAQAWALLHLPLGQARCQLLQARQRVGDPVSRHQPLRALH